MCGISRLVLTFVSPNGEVFPQGLLTKLVADYQPWDIGKLPILPPPNPQAALAAERAFVPTEPVPGVVPVAVLDPPATTAQPDLVFAPPTPTGPPAPNLLTPTLPVPVVGLLPTPPVTPDIPPDGTAPPVVPPVSPTRAPTATPTSEPTEAPFLPATATVLPTPVLPITAIPTATPLPTEIA